MKSRSISTRSTLLIFPVISMFFPIRAYSNELFFEQQTPDSIIGWEWDTLQADWEPDSRIVYTLNDEQQILTDQKFNWSGGGWANSRIKTNTYDDKGNLIQEKFDRWLGVWTNNSIYDYTYNEVSDQTSETRRVWSDTAYVNEYKYVYGYDSDHNQINKLRQWWLPSGYWDTNYKETYTYNDEGNFIHELHEGWNNGWQTGFQIFYSYNDFNQLDTSLEQIFIGPGFRNDVRIINLYDDNQNLVQSTREDFVNNTWRFSRRNLYTYTPDNDLHTDVTQLFEGGVWVNRNLFVYETDEADRIISRVELGWDGIWEKIDSLHYYFNTVSGVHQPDTDNRLVLFPNPAGEQLIVKWQAGAMENMTIEIYSATGVKVYQGVNSSEEPIDIRQLLPGRYYVNCRVGDTLFTKGFVKM